MQFLDIQDKDFDKKFAAILTRGEETGREVEDVVKGIIADVRTRGDEALLLVGQLLDQEPAPREIASGEA